MIGPAQHDICSDGFREALCSRRIGFVNFRPWRQDKGEFVIAIGLDGADQVGDFGKAA